MVKAGARALELLQAAAGAAQNKKAEAIVAIDVTERLGLTDAFLMASGTSERQVGAIVDEIEEKLLAAGAKTLHREGLTERRWVLLDYGDIVVHVLHAEDRAYYALEKLWKDCPEITLTTLNAAGVGT